MWSIFLLNFPKNYFLVHLLYGYFSMCTYIYFTFVFIHMKSKRYIDGSSENLNHIPALTLVGDWPFLMDQFHFSQRHIYPWNFNYYHEDSTNSVILLISSCPEGVYLPFIPSLAALLLPPCHALCVGLP